MQRLEQLILIGSFTAFSWLAMQAVHELGHVLGAAATGGTVQRVVLHPLTISRTDVAPNPHPLLETWAGPVVGVVLPLTLWLLAAVCRCPGLHLFRFFAGFCLVANGAYIAGGAFLGLADAGVLLAHGAPRWQLLLFGLPAMGLGFWLWNGLGPAFGLGPAQGRVSRRATILLSLAWPMNRGRPTGSPVSNHSPTKDRSTTMQTLIAVALLAALVVAELLGPAILTLLH